MEHDKRHPPSMRQRWRQELVWLLLLVAALQGAGSMLAAMQHQRHAHRAASALEFPLTAVHVHDGRPHHHGASEPGLIVLGDNSDAADGLQFAVAFVALLPSASLLSVVRETVRHAPADEAPWRSRSTPPPRRPPRLA